LKPPRIAIPVPNSLDQAYAERALPQYEHAVTLSRGEPVRIPLDQTPSEVMKIIERCDAVLLPGSKADVDPAKYGQPKNPLTAAADPRRDAVDELLLQDAYNLRKPILGICYGLQMLNVYRSGTLLQHIESSVNHALGRKSAMAHEVAIEPSSLLARSIYPETAPIPVNSSHHQAVKLPGDGLKVVARCPQDGVVEAVEGSSEDHFVLAVQWHPERSVDDDRPSRSIFRAFVDAAQKYKAQIASHLQTS
jgi:putative glutamine amidotransferase